MAKYHAVINLKAAGADGMQQSILAGQPIDDFEEWNYEAQMAALRLGHVKKEGAMHKANLCTEGGYLHFKPGAPYVDPKVQMAEAEQAQHHDAQAAVLPVAEQEATSGAFVDGDFAVPYNQDQSAAQAHDQRESLSCPECELVCKTSRGLKKHMAAAHK